ncbi:MAG: hypothetical protein A2275_00135 [Bacteroidetes bacterium RIFOXYA12_FULL_35_11]|nr:MAG: hypothetical protein A2X01_15755 [Bacteroidetes bacterium GWF2_35_48]OFY82162.1 MAG: hypothetical protein A2275_00135 [Bacteroidetes bacterium RIFOXYA12_FULL_35_11]OFY97819.1 MAG: hypothetical protein A2309_13290 [Bacteroidetes bacterium RIFOXYB2_FULL_35_7]OFZ05653.1 MAG: hypothetical protein A2491_20380 [Bacteroidetes bacterium RIFOXYC12_FULL_35_7]HBX52706.1 hypothetical protein [Bacteroidales bacterium]
MKKLAYFIVALSIAVIVSCSSGPDKKIVGSWKIDNVEMSNLEEAVNQALAAFPDSMKEAQKEAMMEGMKQGVEAMKGSTMNFKEDKTFESTFQGKTEAGTWAISEDGKILTTKQGEKEDKLNVDELTDAKLVVSMDQGGSQIKMTLVK